MGDVTGFSPSHLGICVSDLERSMRFYCDGLGFVAVMRNEIGSEFASALEVEPDIEVTTQFISNGAMSIELVQFRSPIRHGGPSAPRPALGLTNLALRVSDIDSAVQRLVECGGTVLEHTRTKARSVELIFVADPDGVRVELLCMPPA